MKILLKRTLKQPGFFITLLLIPILAFLYTTLMKQEDSRIQVGFYIKNDTTSNQELYQNISSSLLSYNGNIVFLAYNSLDQMTSDVADTSLECGYEITSDLIEQMDHGYKKNLIPTYVNNSSTMVEIVNQVFFSCFFTTYSYHLLYQYAESAPELSSISTETWEPVLSKLYQKYSTDGSTFRFEYINEQGRDTLTSSSLLRSSYPGLLAMIVFLCGVIGFYHYLTDQSNHVFCKMPYRRYTLFLIPYLIPYLLSSGILLVFGLLYVNLLPADQILMRSMLYILILYLLFFILHGLHIRRNLLLVFLPLYLCGCFLFTPIFIDLSSIFPFIKYFNWIFIPGLLF